ncbi:MAG: hypothetical protein GX492_10210 [Firmicutes bacterium]|nr:hypothetical protein [Bacillota bacterium]
MLPECAPTGWRNVLTGEILPGPNAGANAPDSTPRQAQAAAAANLLRLADALREFPVVLLTGER